MRIFLSIFCLFMLFGQEIAAQILPHQASYSLSLSTRKQGGQILDITGDVRVLLKQTCDAWHTTHRSNMRYVYSNGRSVPVRSDYTTIESKEEGTFNFASRRYENKKLSENLRGKVVHSDKGVTTHYREGRHYFEEELPQDILFPIKHTQNIIEMAQKGGRYYYAPLFDGSVGGEYYDLNVVIGKKDHIDKEMRGTFWPVSMAFYKGGESGALPEYEMHFKMYANGIVEDIEAVYEAFSLHQTLVDLKLLEVPTCD